MDEWSNNWNLYYKWTRNHKIKNFIDIFSLLHYCMRYIHRHTIVIKSNYYSVIFFLQESKGSLALLFRWYSSKLEKNMKHTYTLKTIRTKAWKDYGWKSNHRVKDAIKSESKKNVYNIKYTAKNSLFAYVPTTPYAFKQRNHVFDVHLTKKKTRKNRLGTAITVTVSSMLETCVSFSKN